MKEKLTEKEEKLIPVFYSKWNTIGTSTTYNKEKMTKAYEWLYEFCELPKPKVIITDGPTMSKKTALEMGAEDTTSLSEDRLSSAGYCAFYDYLSTIFKENVEGFDEYKNFIIHSGVLPLCYDDVVITSIPPTELHFNDAEQLHNPKGVSVKFKDGTAMYHLFGQEFEEAEFETYILKTPTAEVILSIENVDKRTALIQHYGYDFLFSALPDRKVIDSATLKQAGSDKDVNYELIDYQHSSNVRAKVLKVEWWEAGKKKQSVLGVPIRVNNCVEARALTFQMKKDRYAPDIET